MILQFTELKKETEARAKNIILKGLEEHWGTYNEAYNPDVSDLFNTYGSNCIVAWIDETMVGTGCWYRKDSNTAFICRMSVISDLRRKKLGSQILAEVERRINSQQFRFVELETTSSWKNVVRFYLMNGYRVNHETGGDTYLIKDLSTEPHLTYTCS